MACHFQTRGKPQPGTLFTALAAPLFATMHLWAVLARALPGALAALACYAAGIALFWSAVAATRGRRLSACFERRTPQAVVTAGPYRFIRHPFYDSYLLVWTGGLAATGWWPLAIPVVVMGTVYYLAARQEERDLLDGPLGGTYRAYMQKTGAFLPSLRRA